MIFYYSNFRPCSGGPHSISDILVLYANENSKEIEFSFEKSIIADMNSRKNVEDAILCIGYTRWRKMEIEEELANNLWIVAEPNPEIIFCKESSESAWLNALSFAGIDQNKFASRYIKDSDLQSKSR